MRCPLTLIFSIDPMATLERQQSRVFDQIYAHRLSLCFFCHVLAWGLWIPVSNILPDHRVEWAAFYAGVAIVASGVLNRLFTGWLVTQLVLVLIWSMAAMKERLLHLPFLSYDVVFFIKNVRHNLELLYAYPAYSLIGAGVLVVGVGGLAWGMRRESPAISLRKVHQALLHALVACTCLFLVGAGWSRQVFRWRSAHDPGLLQKSIDFMETRSVNILPRFIESFWDFDIVEPHDVLQAFRFQTLMAQSPRSPTVRATAKPDIMVVLRESNANIRQLWETTRASLQAESFVKTDWKGQMRSHSFGGGTWLAEFAFLTGFRALDFGDAGSYAPYTLAPRMREALPVQLHRLGYRTVVFYPVHGTFLNAREA